MAYGCVHAAWINYEQNLFIYAGPIVLTAAKRLCSVGGLLVRRTGGAAGQEAVPTPITWQPAWLVHTERGDSGGGVAELGARLPLPAYGLTLGGAIGPDATLDDLAAAYAQARSCYCRLLRRSACLPACFGKTSRFPRDPWQAMRSVPDRSLICKIGGSLIACCAHMSQQLVYDAMRR